MITTDTKKQFILTFDKVVSVGSNEGVVWVTVVGQCVGITLVDVVLWCRLWSGWSSLGGFLARVLLFINRLGESHLDAGPLHLCAIEVVHGHDSIVSGGKVDEGVVTDFLHSFNTSGIELVEHLIDRDNE